MKRATLCVFATVVLGGPTVALAQEDEATQRAKELFKKAEVHFSVGEFTKALALYKEAFKTKPLPAFLFNIGQCHRNMGRCDKALFFFKQYLIRTPDPPNRADVEKLIKICEAQVKAEKTEPAAATQPAAQPPEPPESAAASRPAQQPEPPPAGETSRRGLSPIWFWSSVGLTGALLVTGTATGVMALSKSDEYKDPSTSIDRRRDLKDSGETLRTVSTATVIAGGVVALGTGVLFFLTDWGSRQEQAISAAPLPGGAAVTMGGRF